MPELQYPPALLGQMTVPLIAAVATLPEKLAEPAGFVAVTVKLYVLPGHNPPTCPPVQPMPVAPPPLREIAQDVCPPWVLVVNGTLIALYPAALAWPAVSVGGPIVVAVTLAAGPVPARLIARTVTGTGELSGNPDSCTLVPPLTVWVCE